MLVHANDWFMLPVEVPVGPGRWILFSTSVAGSADPADFLIVPPRAGVAPPGIRG
jgi:hypothetical protein